MSNPNVVVAGEFVLHDLFYEFSCQVKKKVDALFADEGIPDAKHIMKSLQRGEDGQFDQLLGALGCVAEHCLPSLLETLFEWFNQQIPNFKVKYEGKSSRSSIKSKSDSSHKDEDVKKELREMAIAIVFCLVLIEVLQQLPVHPLKEGQIQHILSLAFTHFRNAAMFSTDSTNNRSQIVADLFAEVLGVMAKTKFQSVRSKFVAELDEAKKTEHNTRIILGLIMGMKFFRVKMYPVEDFEASFRFLRELADYSLEVKDREIKHGLASLFVEILVPVAAAVKTEVNVPVLRDFVDALYPTSLELSKRRKNQLSMYPLVTCLLCVSQKQFFLNNWHIFLDYCLSHLKNRDQKVSRVALESLYRLLWAYTVRIKCESNTTTQSRLQSIVKALFPVGSRSIVPKDTPLSIYVKIIQFIAQERLDFAMKEIILDLLCISLSSSRNAKVMTLQPERMNIGLRAFLVVTDSLQQKDGAPPMPTTVGVMPSGNTLRVKKTFLNKMLTDDEARTIGVSQYHKYVQKALDWILLTLDGQVGQRMMMTNVQVSRASDIIGTENKPKIDLFRTCIAAMPRLIPGGNMSHTDLFEMLSRLTIHIDEELRSLAFASLHSFAQDLPEQREDVVATFVSFILKQVTDTHHLLLDTALRHLVQLITGWRNKSNVPYQSTSFASRHRTGKVSEIHERKNSFSPLINHLQGFALVLLCNNRSVTRKLACLLLKEVKTLARTLNCNKLEEDLCIDALDRLCPETANEVIVKQEVTHNLSSAECRNVLAVASKCDIIALVECSSSWCQHNNVDVWTSFIASFMKPHRLPTSCPSTVEYSWFNIYTRLMQLWQHVDPIQSSKKGASVSGSSDTMLSLWTNYLVYACRSAPTNVTIMKKQLSAIPAGTPDWLVSLSRDSDRIAATPSSFFQRLITLLRGENSSGLKDTAVVGLGSTSAVAFPDLMNELHTVFHEACKSHRQDNMRRKRKRENTRVMLARVLERLARHKVLSESISMPSEQNSSRSNLDRPCDSINTLLLEYIKNTCTYLESIDKTEVPSSQASSQDQLPQYPGTLSTPVHTIQVMSSTTTSQMDELRIYFGSMITYLIRHMPEYGHADFLPVETRRALFFLFGGWCGKYAGTLDNLDSLNGMASNSSALLHATALKAECAVLCCGPVFDKVGLQQEKGYLYPWLETLLDCGNPRVQMLGKEAIVMLLQQNKDSDALVPWLIDKCYTGSLLVSTGCFCSIAAAFNYTCLSNHMIPLLNLALFNVATAEVTQTAQHLLLMLQTRLSLPLAVDNEGDDGVAGLSSVTSLSSKSKSLHLCLNVAHQSHFLNKLYNFSQYDISKDLARLHPEFTMSMLSEIFSRFMSTSLFGKRHMLHYMLPWLKNIELSLHDEEEKILDAGASQKMFEIPLHMLRACGWGSPSATHFLLSNLTYITIRYYSDLGNEVEKCWSTLCHTWPGNLDVLLLYTSALASCGGSDAVSFTSRRLITFFARAKSREVAQYLVRECQIAEAPNFGIEVLDHSPFFKIKLQDVKEFERSRLSKLSPRLRFMEKSRSAKDLLTSSAPNSYLQMNEFSSSQNIRRTSNSTLSSSLKADTLTRDVPHHMSLQHLNKGQEQYLKVVSPTKKSGSMLSLPNFNTELPMSPKSISAMKFLSLKSRSPAKSRPVITEVLITKPKTNINSLDENDVCHSNPFVHWRYLAEAGDPNPLPMPSTPLFYLHLADFMSAQDVEKYNGLLRSNIACLLLSEIVVEHGVVIDWKSKTYLPTILLSIFLGMDVSCEEVACRCQFLLAHIIVHLLTPKQQALLASSVVSDSTEFFFNTSADVVKIGITPSSVCTTDSGIESNASPLEADDPTQRFQSCSGKPLSSPSYDSHSLAAYVKKLLTRTCGQLWDSEDATPKSPNLKSTEHLTEFVCQVNGIFEFLIPELGLKKKLAKHALKFAVRTSSRHCASRALQIFRSLNLPLQPHNISELSLCLTDCIAEGNDQDSQSWAIEILITLLQTCEIISKSMNNHPARQQKSFETQPSSPRMSTYTSSSHKDAGSESPKNSSGRPVRGHAHRRSGSVSINKKLMEGVKKVVHPLPSINSDPCIQAHKYKSDASTNVSSATKIPNAIDTEKSLSTLEEWKSGLAQIFWIAVGILESDFDHEYLIALRIIKKVLEQLPLYEADGKQRIERAFSKIQWHNFQGLQTLLLKGLICNTTFEASFSILSDLTTVTSLPIMCTSNDGNGFAMNVIALLPRLINQFGDPDPLCCECAQNVAQVCVDYFKEHIKLQSLAHVMSLYSNNTYNKSMPTWVNVVCKYVYETFPQALLLQLTFLTEMLDKGHTSFHVSCLHVSHSLLSLSPALSDEGNCTVIHELLHTVSKHLNSKQYWKESLSILKLAVSRSSQLASPSSTSSLRQSGDVTEMLELPGLTLSFKFDLSNTQHVRERSPENKDVPSQFGSSWRKPHLSQRRTRERLRSVLSTCSIMRQDKPTQNAFKLQEHKEVEDQNNLSNQISEYSSSPENDSSALKDKVTEEDGQYQVFRDFDFLNEIEEADGEGADNFNTGMQWNTSGSSDDVTNEVSFIEEQPDECDLTSIVLNVSQEDEEDEDDSDTVSISSHTSSVVSNPNLQQSSTENVNSDVDASAPPSSSQVSGTNSFLEPSSMLYKTSTDTYLRAVSPSPPEMLRTSGANTPGDVSNSGSSDSESSYTDKSSDVDELPSAEWPAPNNSGPSNLESDEVSDGSFADMDSSSIKTSESGGSPTTEICKEEEEKLSSHGTLQDIKRWKTCLSSAFDGSDDGVLSNFFVVFPSLFHQLCIEFRDLCKSGCSYLGTQLSSISGHFSSMVEDLPTQLECSLCISSEENFLNLHSSLQSGITSLQNQFESYEVKHIEAESLLDTILQIRVESNNMQDTRDFEEQSIVLQQKQLELCQLLYTLHFKLLVIFQTFCKLVNAFTSKSQERTDVTKTLIALHKQVLSEDKKEEESSSEEKCSDLEGDMRSMTSDEAVVALNMSLEEKDFKLSVAQLRVLRRLWPSGNFGEDEDSAANYLTMLYYQHNTAKDHEGEAIHCVLGENAGMQDWCEKLMDVNMQIQQSLQLLEVKPKVRESKEQSPNVAKTAEDEKPISESPATEEVPTEGQICKRTPF
ncbi:protein furry homolog-like isoform X2 [Clavelina lepadiformis]|uniref:protein furry homolog-like isoform X2 n=1 Tax=Clavelina lepadiformis TaxID=159417 RepID=UPI0040438B25